MILLLNACFEPREACLDIAATNFDASADKDCCCRYPKLVLSVDQVYDTLLFRQDSLYVGAADHLFRIKSIVFYLSDFQVFKNGVPFEMMDSVVLKTETAANDTIDQIYKDDFTLIRRAPLDNIVGTIREDGFFEKINFRLGLSEPIERVVSSLAPASNPLSTQPENLAENGFVFMQLVVVRDSMAQTAPDTLHFRRAELGDFYIEGTGNFQHKTGYDFPMKLQADWAKLFEGVNWTTGDKVAWKSRIVANLPGVFIVSQ